MNRSSLQYTRYYRHTSTLNSSIILKRPEYMMCVIIESFIYMGFFRVKSLIVDGDVESVAVVLEKISIERLL